MPHFALHQTAFVPDHVVRRAFRELRHHLCANCSMYVHTFLIQYPQIAGHCKNSLQIKGSFIDNAELGDSEWLK